MGASHACLGAAGIASEGTGAGCCGVAGAFGYETEHYDVSVAIANDRLVPAVEAARSSTVDRGGGHELSRADRPHDGPGGAASGLRTRRGLAYAVIEPTFEPPSSWRRDFPGVPPIGHLARARFPDRWLRIHSLPGSKRYSESRDDELEVSRRMTAAAVDLLQAAPCLLFTTVYDESGWQTETEPTRWDAARYAALLRDVADDRTGPVLFYAVGQGRAFAPYDGGADLFFETEVARDAARRRYGAWLSLHPDGL